MAVASNSQIVDEFEASFQACLAGITNPDHNSIRDSEETKAGVEQAVQKFLDLAKQMECFFLQKRLVVSSQKPEQVVMEDNAELKNELARKDQLLERYHNKLQYWQSLVNDPNIGGAPPPQHVVPGPPTGPGMVPQGSVGMMGSQGPPGMGAGPTGMGSPVMGPPQGPMGTPPQVPMGQGMSPGMMGPGPQQVPMGPTGPLAGGPLAYLERTTSSIGMPDHRR